MTASADPAFNYYSPLRFSLMHRSPSMSWSHVRRATRVDRVHER
jgi:hypothetical protein